LTINNFYKTLRLVLYIGGKLKIKILKKENEVSKVEIDGREYQNISKVEIKNDYTSNGINESVITEFKDISLLEISTDK